MVSVPIIFGSSTAHRIKSDPKQQMAEFRRPFAGCPSRWIMSNKFCWLNWAMSPRKSRCLAQIMAMGGEQPGNPPNSELACFPWKIEPPDLRNPEWLLDLFILGTSFTSQSCEVVRSWSDRYFGKRTSNHPKGPIGKWFSIFGSKSRSSEMLVTNLHEVPRSRWSPPLQAEFVYDFNFTNRWPWNNYILFMG
jgi:hypothetical protein